MLVPVSGIKTYYYCLTRGTQGGFIMLLCR